MANWNIRTIERRSRWNSPIRATESTPNRWPIFFNPFSRQKRRDAARVWDWLLRWKQYGRMEVRSRSTASRGVGHDSRSYFQQTEERAEAATISRNGSGR